MMERRTRHFSAAALLAFSVLLCVLAGTVRASSQCYLEGSSCALCWRTDSAGTRSYSECPDYVSLTFSQPPPVKMFEGEEYAVEFSVTVNRSALAIAPVAQRSDDLVGPLVDVSHANVHSCFSAAGSCTPFIEASPGLSTHTPEQWGNLTSPGDTAVFRTTISQLLEGKYTVISHVRFAVLENQPADPLGGCGGPDCLTVSNLGAPRHLSAMHIHCRTAVVAATQACIFDSADWAPAERDPPPRAPAFLAPLQLPPRSKDHSEILISGSLLPLQIL